MAAGLTATICTFAWSTGLVMTLPTALSEKEKQVGLSGQSEVTAMAFAWTDAQLRPVWMQETTMPLSVGWVDITGRLIETLQLDAYDTTIRWSSKPVSLMIELPIGGFSDNGIEVGDRITRMECGSNEENT